MKAKWTTISDRAVRRVWTCLNRECGEHLKEQTSRQADNAPRCVCCGGDNLMYVRTDQRESEAIVMKTHRRKWTLILDGNVRHHWVCLETDEQNEICGEKAIVDPSWYCRNGTPVCPKCGQDMEYERTEVLI